MALDVIQGVGEIGQLLVQGRHVGQAAGLDLEALGAAFQHALVRGAQMLVVPVRELGQLALHLVGAEYAAQIRDRQLE